MNKDIIKWTENRLDLKNKVVKRSLQPGGSGYLRNQCWDPHYSMSSLTIYMMGWRVLSAGLQVTPGGGDPNWEGRAAVRGT